MTSTANVPRESIGTAYRLLSRQPNWSTRIPGEYVHKHDPDSVYICSITRAGTNTFRIAAVSPDSDFLTYTEIMRQAGIAAAHIGFGVTFDIRFMASDTRFSINDLDALANPQSPLLLTLSAIRPAYKDGQLRYTRFVVKMSRNGDEFAHGSGFLACTPADVFARVEKRLEGSAGAHEFPKLPPEVVGKKDLSEVMLAGTDRNGSTGRWRIIAPSEYSASHLSAMSQLETFRQCGHALLGADWKLTSIEATFMKMVHPRAELFCQGVVDARVDSSKYRVDNNARAREGKSTVQVRVELTDQDRTVFTHGSAQFVQVIAR